MGYKIQYEPELDHKYNIPGGVRLKRVWIIRGCAALGVLLLGLIPSVRTWLWELLIPGDANITSAAFGTLISDVREGMGLADAVTVFCKEILANG